MCFGHCVIWFASSLLGHERPFLFRFDPSQRSSSAPIFSVTLFALSSASLKAHRNTHSFLPLETVLYRLPAMAFLSGAVVGWAAFYKVFNHGTRNASESSGREGSGCF